MQRQAFGRRTTVPQEPPQAPAEKPAAPATAEKPVPQEKPSTDDPPPSPFAAAGDVERDIENWNDLRKAKKRSFREPWRTCAIVTTGFFALSSWLLPDSVSDVAQLLTVALTVASIWAGWRRPAVG